MIKEMDRCRIISGKYVGETGKVYSTWYDFASVLMDCDIETLRLKKNLDSLLFTFKQIELEKI